jgi:hypothetical protein
MIPSERTVQANGNGPPDFYVLDRQPAGGAGGTVVAILSLGPAPASIPLEPGAMVHTETFVYRSALVLAEGDAPRLARVSLAEGTLGDPPVAAAVVAEGERLRLDAGAEATVWAGPCAARRFLRADANNDSRVDIADAVRLLAYKFRGGLPPLCMDAADANDDGAIDQSDVIFVVSYVFSRRLAPPPPFPACGLDPTPDDLTCEFDGAGCP